MTLVLSAGLLWPSISLAYVGLCCAHCGGNMPLNVPGGGIPEPKEYRLKISQMIMSMGPLRDGTTNLSEGSQLLPVGPYAVAPSAMQMYMTMVGGAYSFTDNFALMAMTSFKFNRMQMEFNGALQGLTGESGFTMESRGFGDIKLLGKYRMYSDDHLAPKDQVFSPVRSFSSYRKHRQKVQEQPGSRSKRNHSAVQDAVGEWHV